MPPPKPRSVTSARRQRVRQTPEPRRASPGATGSSAAELSSKQALAFDEFAFDLGRRALRYRGTPVDLEPRVAELLAYLVKEHGRVVSRHELLSQLWPRATATDTALNYTVSALRRALSPCAKPPLSALRGKGYRFDAAIRDATPDLDAERLIGRSTELARLRRVAASCIDQSMSRLVLLTGPAGIGKSRLGQEVCAEWAAHGHRRLSGRCTLTEGAPPLWPWWALLRESNLDLPALPVSRADRWAHFVKLREALERVARGRPLLITLDDVHLADEDSLAFLHFLASDPRPCPVLYLASCRSPLAPSLEPLFRDLMRHAEVVVLGPLDEGGSQRLLRSCLGSRFDADLGRDALASAAGNPLFIKETAFALRDQPGRAVRDLAVESLPGTHAAIASQLAALGEPALEVLRAAAVAGEDFDARLVAAALGKPLHALLPALEAASKLAIIRPSSVLEYRFVHALLRHHLYTVLSELERRELHHRIGTCLVQSGEHRSGVGLSQAAHHLAEGVLGPSEAARAAEISRSAADSLAQRFAFEPAAREYRRALKLTALGGGAGAQRIGLMIRAAECLRVEGRHAEAQELAREGVELARALEDHVCLGEATCALVDLETLSPDTISPHLSLLHESSKQVPVSEVRLRSRLQAHLAISMSYGSRFEDRVASCGEALRLSEGQDAKTRALALFARALAHFGALPRQRDWEDWVEQSVAAARAANDPRRELHGVCLQLAAALETGRIELAERRARALDELGRAIGSAYCRFVRRAFAACLAVFRGSPDAEALCRAAYELGQSSSPGPAESVFRGQMFVLAIETGMARSILPAMRAVSDAPDAHPLQVCGLGLAQSLAGDAPGSRATYERLRAASFPVSEDNLGLAVLAASAELCAYQRDSEHAALLYERLAPFEDRLGITGFATSIFAVPAYALARLALVLGRARAAREHLVAARKLCERLGSGPWVQRCSLGLDVLEASRALEVWAPRGLTRG